MILANKTQMVTIIVIVFFILLYGSVSMDIVGANEDQLILTEIGSIPDSQTCDVKVNGDILFDLNAECGLVTYNISNPTTSDMLGRCTDTSSCNILQTSNQGDLILVEVGQVVFEDAADIHVVDNIAYVSDMGNYSTDNRMVIVNVSNPSDPQILSEIQVLASHSLYVDGNIAYVANGGFGLELINVSDPSNPSRISCFNDGGEIYSIYVYDDFAYAGDGEDGVLEIIDVQDPINPVEVGQFQTGIPYGIDVDGDLAIIGTLSDGLVFLNVSNPSLPELIWESNTAECNPDIEIIGDIAYVSCHENGLRILNISDPNQPEELFNFQKEGEFLSLDVIDNLVCQATYSQGVSIIDISDPSNPKALAHYYDGGKAKGIDVVNDLIFVADQGDGLEILKIKPINHDSQTQTISSIVSSEPITSSEPINSSALSFELFLVTFGLIIFLVLEKRKKIS